MKNIMLQQAIALIIIVFFLVKLFRRKKKERISAGEFVFWLIFWILAGLAVVFIRQIDKLVADLGFSGSGIEVLLYLGVVILFYAIFRLRLKMEKMEKNITILTREISKYRKNNEE